MAVAETQTEGDAPTSALDAIRERAHRRISMDGSLADAIKVTLLDLVLFFSCRCALGRLSFLSLSSVRVSVSNTSLPPHMYIHTCVH